MGYDERSRMPKLLDRLLKSLAVDDPRALYHLLSEPLPPEDAEIEPMVQEIITKLSALDYWCVFRVGKRERADVFEFKGKYEGGMHRQLLRYAMAACVTTGFSVRATAIVVSSKGLPWDYEDIEPFERAGLRLEFRTVRLWEVDAQMALDLERHSLLSLVPFMKHTWTQLAQALRRIPNAAAGALDMFWHALLLRYSKEEAERLQAEVGMNSAIMERIWNELLPDSPWAEEIRKEARESALAEGRREGELRYARQQVVRLLRNRFPDVSSTGIEAAADLAGIDRAIDELFQAQSADQARTIMSALLNRGQ